MEKDVFNERLLTLCQDYERMSEQNTSDLREEMKCTRLVIQAYEVLHQDYIRQLRQSS